ncbi:SET domain protein [Hortaea werneckii]|uniref:SET domain-containing protein n=1 Tax=Hortaea werneckii TaxID=91943 RepID=A0A3M7CTV7_HORWE|nr:SET domain protein [Hortaea werneckii]RMY55433.1 hypothetical protein D0865_04182 [Hortaea werneckii]
MAEADGPDVFVQKSNSFLSWLEGTGATVSSKIQLEDLRQQHRGRGVLAKQDIAEDEELFAVPRAAVLNTDTSTLPHELKMHFDDPWLSLITVMIYEYQRGTESKWKPYFDVLPETFTTLMFWKPEELNYLAGSAVVNKIGKESADEAFLNEIVPILKQDSHVFKTDGVDDAELLRLCHRMGSTIMAYAFDLEKPESDQPKPGDEEWEDDEEETEILPKGMVPMADMLNADADRNNAKLYYEEDKVVMKSIQPIKAGEELFNDYGPLPNADVLRRYGYTTENYSKYDVVDIDLATIKRRSEMQHKESPNYNIEDRLQYLEEQGVLDDGYDVAHGGSEDFEQFPEELCVALNTLCAANEDFDKWKRKDKLPKPELTDDALRLLYDILAERRADYGFVEVDPKDISTPKQMDAWRVLAGEKSLLHEAAETVQQLRSQAGGSAKDSSSGFEQLAQSIKAAREQTNGAAMPSGSDNKRKNEGHQDQELEGTAKRTKTG